MGQVDSRCVGIAVLGPLSIDGVASVLGRRDRAVLSALAVRPGEVLSADQLAEVLWPDEPPASWAKVVQGCVVRLRKLLGPGSIETLPSGYRLTLAHDQIDAQRFERATERGRALLNGSDDADRAAFVIGEALSLWRGPALGDVEDWAPGRIEAGRLDELHREAEELYVEASLRSGHSEKVLARAQTLVHEQPLRERRWALLALAQYQAGQQNEALITLRRVRKVFNRDLGVDPGPELAQLEQAMLRQDPALFERAPLPEPSAVCPYRGLLPYDTDNADTFFGRSDDVDDLSAAAQRHWRARRGRTFRLGQVVDGAGGRGGRFAAGRTRRHGADARPAPDRGDRDASSASCLHHPRRRPVRGGVLPVRGRRRAGALPGRPRRAGGDRFAGRGDARRPPGGRLRAPRDSPASSRAGCT